MAYKSIETSWFSCRHTDGSFISKKCVEDAPGNSYFNLDLESDCTLAHRFQSQSEALSFIEKHVPRSQAQKLSVIYITVSWEYLVS